MKTFFLFTFVIITTCSLRLSSQEQNNAARQLNFYLDCWDCDFNFVRQNLDFVSFVRDPKLANVHILVSRARTGGGGSKYFLNFIGLQELKDLNYQYEYLSEQSETHDETRKGLLKLIQTGILQYYSQTAYFNQIEIDLKQNENKSASELVDDPWKLWVFRLSAGSELQKEESQNEYAFDSEIRIEKITDKWKTRLEADYDIFGENYFDNGKKIANKQDQTEIQLYYIKSLSSRWSAGLFQFYQSATFLNLKSSIQGSAGIEYNIFPWDISNRKVFAIRYQVGVKTFKYNELTIYDKLHENLLYQSAGINLELVQPWGRVDARLEGSNFLSDFSKNRFTLMSDLSVRLTKQLSVFAEFYGQIIHDQLYLPKGDASLEDVLLKRRKLATSYETGTELGLRFTFGSIYNSVVNERF